jgi:hypothetical protein
MLIKTFHHKFPETEVKFSIFQKTDSNAIYYYACAVDINLEVYSSMTSVQKSACYGAKVTDGKDGVVYYLSSERLVSDLVTKFGVERLTSEK